MMTEEDVRMTIVMEQLIALKEIDYNKYLKISRDFDDIMYPSTQNTGSGK